MKNELKPSYQLIETNIKTGKKSICKSFYTYVDAKKHLKEFYEFLIDDRIEKIESLKLQYTEIGYTTSEINTLIYTDIKVPVLFNRNTALLDDGYRYQIKKCK